ncbi:protein CURVATURE THYLAKOID 1A, chloroplastic-like [Carex rostrata]
MASMACTAAIGGLRLSTPRAPLLPPPQIRSVSSSCGSGTGLFASTRLSNATRFPSIQLRATSSSEDTSSSVQGDDILADLKQKWDALDNKSTVLLYGGGAIVAIWVSSIVVSAINSVPLLPKIMELVGLGYSGWFVYRYLLFKESRKELVSDIEALKQKITGPE